MKKLLGVVGAVAVAVSLGATPSASEATAGPYSRPDATRAVRPAVTPGFSMRDTFSREVTRYGAVDSSPYHIAHVVELQYRLRWAGVYHAGVTGNFGPITRRAVKTFQKREGLRVSGDAGHTTWAHRFTTPSGIVARFHISARPGAGTPATTGRCTR